MLSDLFQFCFIWSRQILTKESFDEMKAELFGGMGDYKTK